MVNVAKKRVIRMSSFVCIQRLCL